jgi:hypothetical protein
MSGMSMKERGHSFRLSLKQEYVRNVDEGKGTLLWNAVEAGMSGMSMKERGHSFGMPLKQECQECPL